MSIEKISIIDSLGQEYTLPKTFELRSEPIAKKSDILSLAFVHGAKDVSDGMFRPRIIEVSGKILAKSDTAYNEKWDAIAEHLIKEDIRIQNKGRQINIIKIEDISHEYPSQVNYHYGEISIRFLAIDPFWYSKTAKEKDIVITSSPKNFQFDIGGQIETFPEIKIENNADNIDFTLENTTDDERSFRIQDPNALNGTTIIVDCKEGTAIRDESNNIISVFSGLFLRLLGGRQNSFKYTGSNCKITMQYKEAWI